MLKSNFYNARQIRKMEQIAINQYEYCGLSLMKTAGEQAFTHIMSDFCGVESLVILCGAGNNGGDGYVVAECARAIGLDVVVVQASVAKTADAMWVCQEFVEHGGVVTNDMATLRRAGLIVDALFGIGLNRAPSGFYADLIRTANQTQCPVVALDIPSGLNSDTGFAFSPCIVASMTITFIAQKFGLFTGQGTHCSGIIKFADLNLPHVIQDTIQGVLKPIATLIKSPKLKPRLADSHKGDYGNIIVAGGDNGMLGAVLLAGRAALRCGSGRVTVLSTTQHLDMPALHCPELISQCIENESALVPLLERSDVVVIGPGLGLSDWSKQLFNRLLDGYLLDHHRLARHRSTPMLIDADGLILLAENPQKYDYWVLTPHPKEAAKLLGCSTADVQKDRIGAVKSIAERFGGVCVLKGAGTLVADSSAAVSVCDCGNPGMATAGMGDVLSGIIAALIGQHLDRQHPEQHPDLGKIAQTGVWLHSMCSDNVSARTGMAGLLAGDVIDALPAMLSSLENIAINTGFRG